MAATRTAGLSMGIVMLLTVVLWAGGSMAQSSDCSGTLNSLQPCLSYVTGSSSTPTETCCSQLRTVVGSSPLCLCQLVTGNFGVPGINQTRALELPAACNVPTPPVSRCNGASPSASPGGTPVPGTPSSPEGSGSDSSDGSSIKASTSLLLFFFFVMAASYCSSASMRY